MAGRKVIFIIPGYRQKTTSRAYQDLAKILKKNGYSPILVDVPWKNSTISQNAEYFLTVYKCNPSKNKYILGFSYGAMIAFIAATQVTVSGLILCSLSPFFKEDLSQSTLKSVRSTLMNERYHDFARFHCKTLAKQLKTKKVTMLYGSEEAKALIRRVTKAFQHIECKDKQLISIPEIEHTIGHHRYLTTIHDAARYL